MKMIINPVYRREVISGFKSVKFAVAVSVFNAFLAFIALAQMSAAAEGARMGSEAQYGSFLLIFRLIALLEFLLIYLITPALTSGSLSSEWENKSMDLILSTKISGFDLVAGKLLFAVATILLLLLSGIPVFAMIPVYGGILGRDIPRLLLPCFSAAFFVGSLGIFFSALFKKSTMATVLTYAAVLIISLLTFMPGAFIKDFIPGNVTLSYPQSFSTNMESLVEASQGALLYPWFYICNPINLFYITVNEVIGNRAAVAGIFEMMGIAEGSFLHGNWFFVGLGFQFLAGGVLTLLSAWNITPKLNRIVLIKKIGRKS